MQRISSSGFAQFVRVETCRICKGKGEVLDNPCKDCRGNGTVQKTRKISVKIPAGIDNESSLRLRSEGDAGDRGAAAGDLYVVCHIIPHSIFVREDSDLRNKVSIDMASAALGTTIQVPTIEGKNADVLVPSGTQNGTVLKLKGKGLPSLGGSHRGNQLVTINVAVPTKLTDKQKELLNEFKRLEDEKRKGFFKF